MMLYLPGFAAVLYGGLGAVLLASLALIVGVGVLGTRRRPAARRSQYVGCEPRRVGFSHPA